MKVLLVGSKLPHAIENYFVKYLMQFGAIVIHFPAPDIALNKTNKTIVHKVLRHSKIYTAQNFINKKVLQLAKDEKPDIVWIFKGMEMYASTIQELKKTAKVGNFNADHPFLFFSRGGGNKNIVKNFTLYDFHFCYQQNLVQEIKEKYKIETIHLPFAYDEAEVVRMPFEEVEEINRVCFQANPDPLRIEVVKKMRDNGIEIDLFGIGWEKTFTNKSNQLRIFPIANRKEFWKINQQYRVQLNMFRQHNEGSHNMRTFEIPANGGIQVAPFSKEQEQYFEDGKEIIYYKSIDEMIEKVKFLLQLPSPEAVKIRKAALERSQQSGYTFTDRSKTVYQTFQSMLQKNEQ